MKQTVIFAQESATQSDHAVNTGERLVNVYPARAGGSARSDLVLRHCAGYGAEFKTLEGTSMNLLSMCASDVDLMVSAWGTAPGASFTRRSLFRIEADGTQTTIADATDASVIGNIGDFGSAVDPGVSGGDYTIWAGRQVLSLPNATGGGCYYILYDDATNATVAIPGPPPPTLATPDIRTVTFLGQYAIWTGSTFENSTDDSRIVQWSDLGDLATFPALNFRLKESFGDPAIRVLASQGILYVFGRETFEIWGLTGQSGADAFTRISDSAVSVGLRLANIAIDYEDSLYFLADDKTFLRAVGFSLERLSTPALEAVLQDNDPTHIFVYEHRGHKFVCLRFSDRPAWCFDITTGLWHERSTGAALGAWEIIATAFVFDAWHGATADGRIYAFDDTCADDATAMTRLAISRPLDINGDVFRVANLQVRAQPDDTSYDIDMRHSRDGGRNWSTARTYSMASTNRSGRARWNGLGSGRLFQVELTLDDSVGAPIEAEAVIEVT